MTKIKPCPFCGDRGRRRTIPIDETKLVDKKWLPQKTGKIILRRMIECRNQKCSIRPGTWLHVSTENWKVVIRAWNKRSKSPDERSGV